MKQTIYILLLVLMVTACREPENAETVPALLTNQGEVSHAEVQKTISAALDGAEVTLAADVFTSNSVVVIERGMIRGITRTPEMGRDLGRPSRFQLVTDGVGCIIVDEQSGIYWPLSNVECVKTN